MTYPPLPLPQSREFERCCELLEIPVQRHDRSDATCLVQTRHFPVIGPVNLISRGPVSSAPDSNSGHISEIIRDLKGPLCLNLPIGSRPPRAWRVLEGSKLALLDLKSPAQMRAGLAQKWRNQLNKAERQNLTVIDQPLDAQKHAWFLNAEAAQQKQRRYRNHPTGFLLAYAKANKGQARLYTAIGDAGTAAAILILRHGRMATYQAGVTTESGRKLNAHNLLLWRAMCDLQKRGYEQLDLGRADLNKGLTHFKLGTGARTETLIGSFLMHRWAMPKIKPPQPIKAGLSLDVPEASRI